jgi:4-diphosphocytidyl-2C-methyl-D-erythritol kinase
LELKTPEVYGKLKMGLTVNSAKVNIRVIKPLLARFPQKTWPGFNRLEDVVLPSQPSLQRIVLELRELAPVAMLSGSGAAVVAVFLEGIDLTEILEEFGEAGLYVRVVGPHSAGVEITDD